MSAARGTLAGLVALSVSLTLLPAAFGAPLQPWALSGAPDGAFRVDLAPVPGSGAVLVAATGPLEVQFYLLGEAGTGPAAPLSSVPIRADSDSAVLACSRLAVLDLTRVLVAYTHGTDVRALVVNPMTGEVVADTYVYDWSTQPCAAVDGDHFLLSLMQRDPSLGTTTVLAGVDRTGARVNVAAPTTYGAGSVALIQAAPLPLLVEVRASSLSVFAVNNYQLEPRGAYSIGASSGALWARDGFIHGLLSTATGLVRMHAPVDGSSGATLESIAGGANAIEVSAIESADGMLIGAVRQGTGTLVVREDAIGQYSTATLSGVRAAAAASDGFGLARIALLRGTSAETLTAGDNDAVAVSLAGPAAFHPGEKQTFSATVRAVRSSITLVGLDVALPPGWVVEAPSTTTALPQGTSTVLTFAVTAPPGTPAGAYVVSATPAVVEAAYAPSATLSVTVLGGPALSVLGSTGSLDLTPGTSTTLSVTLVNRGGAAVLAQVSPSTVAGLVVLPSTQTVSVAPGASTQVTFTVTAAEGAVPVDGATLTLRVVPSDQSLPTTVDIPARIRGVFLPELAAGTGDISALAGSTVAVPFTLSNTGNIGGLVALHAAVIGLQGAALSGPPPLVFVPAFSQVAVPVSLDLPTHAQADGAYRVSLTATRAVDGGDLGTVTRSGAVRTSLAFTASIGPTAPALPGTDVPLTLTLSNAGNAPVTTTVDFGALPSGYSLAVAAGYAGGILVAPFSAVQVPLVAHLAADALPGVRVFTVAVAATPGGTALVEASVEVLATHGLALSVIAAPAPFASREVTAGTFDFQVSNPGNTPADVHLSFGAPLLSLSALRDGAVTAPASSPISLPPHASLMLRARLPATFAAGATTSSTSVTAESSAGDAVSAAVNFVRLSYDLRVADLSVRPLRGEAVAGALHTVSVTFANAGPGTASLIEAVLTANGLVVGRVPIAPVSAGASRVLQFDVVPTVADTEYTLSLSAPADGLDRDAGNDAASLHYTVAVPAPAPSLPPSAAPVAASGISILTLLALALSEIGKITLISALFVPLYVKLKPEEVLDQYLRGQIHGYIIANPGEHYNAIKDQLGVTNGALAYHLRVLERAELIRAVRDGMYKRFYPVGVKIPKRKRLSPFQAAIVRAVRANPDLSQKQLAEILGVSNQVVNYNVKQLEDAQILKVDRSARASKLQLGPEAPPPDDMPPAPAPLAPPAPL